MRIAQGYHAGVGGLTFVAADADVKVMFPTTFRDARPRRWRLAANVILVAGVAAGCTKVNEQPPAPPAAVAPEPVVDPVLRRAEVARGRRPDRGTWSAVSKPTSGAAVAGGSKSPEDSAPQGTGPTSVPREKLQEILDAALPTLTSCWGNESALQTSIAFEVTGAGKAENVRMPGAPKDAERCVVGRISALALPTYTGPSLTIQIPVSVTPGSGRSPAAAAGAPGVAGAARGTTAVPATTTPAAVPAPTVFVNP